MKTTQFIIVLSLMLGLTATGCANKKAEKTSGPQGTASAPAAAAQPVDKSVQELIATLQATKVPYTGNLTPDKAAEITNAVAKVSLAEIPSRDLPKDPKVMIAINDRIRQKSDAIYAQFSTTMGEVMRYISDLSPQDREKYNKKLTDLFLEDSRKRADNAAKESPAPKPSGKK
jgi:hypothetical protein